MSATLVIDYLKRRVPPEQWPTVERCGVIRGNVIVFGDTDCFRELVLPRLNLPQGVAVTAPMFTLPDDPETVERIKRQVRAGEGGCGCDPPLE